MSFIDARDLPDGGEIDADLIVIGGGMAGIAIATERAGTSLKVAVLESGGRELDEEVQDLSRGSGAFRAPGYPDRPIDEYLKESRRRGLGGSAAIWGAKCVPLDEADFAAREWLDRPDSPRTGWPMTRAGLQPYYDRACTLLQIEPFHRDYDADPEEGRPALRIGDGRDYFAAPRRFSPVNGGAPEVFDRFRTEFAEAENIDVYLNANVTEIRVGRLRRGVAGLEVACLDGKRHSARARAYVLATGGIENARLLLASRSRMREGVGNENGLVGRCFAGHVTFGAMPASPNDMADPDKQFSGLAISAPQLMSLYTDLRAPNTHCVIAATLEGQRRVGAGNFTTTLFGPVPRAGDDVNALMGLSARLDGGPSADAARNYVGYFMSEQLPNLDSRVTLDETSVDALGMPRARLGWSFTAEDFDRLESSITALTAALGTDGKGRLCFPVAREQLLSILDPSRHHIGTTRMHADPEHGVVDADCKVHGLSNLYIAGSSVFPTAGIANPTLTIIALAMRLSDHLKAELGEA
jgi:choline dehydrogenase-like flavoprotein